MFPKTVLKKCVSNMFPMLFFPFQFKNRKRISFPLPKKASIPIKLHIEPLNLINAVVDCQTTQMGTKPERSSTLYGYMIYHLYSDDNILIEHISYKSLMQNIQPSNLFLCVCTHTKRIHEPYLRFQVSVNDVVGM